MAQTRAGSKALRQILGFVVALAGYSPTPADEMILESAKQPVSEPVKEEKWIEGSSGCVCGTKNAYHSMSCPARGSAS